MLEGTGSITGNLLRCFGLYFEITYHWVGSLVCAVLNQSMASLLDHHVDFLQLPQLWAEKCLTICDARRNRTSSHERGLPTKNRNILYITDGSLENKVPACGQTQQQLREDSEE